MELQIQQERKSHSWTQDYVAKQIGISSATICMIETGRRKPSYDVLIKLLELYGYDDPRRLFATIDKTNLLYT